MAKGMRIELDGIERVENRDTYKLKLTLKKGDLTHVWVDARTFLETKVEGQPRRLDGTYHPVEVYYRDYRNVNGLEIPFVVETRVLPVVKTLLGMKDTPVPPEKTLIEKGSDKSRVRGRAVFEAGDLRCIEGQVNNKAGLPGSDSRISRPENDSQCAITR